MMPFRTGLQRWLGLSFVIEEKAVGFLDGIIFNARPRGSQARAHYFSTSISFRVEVKRLILIAVVVAKRRTFRLTSSLSWHLSLRRLCGPVWTRFRIEWTEPSLMAANVAQREISPSQNSDRPNVASPSYSSCRVSHSSSSSRLVRRHSWGRVPQKKELANSWGRLIGAPTLSFVCELRDRKREAR